MNLIKNKAALFSMLATFILLFSAVGTLADTLPGRIAQQSPELSFAHVEISSTLSMDIPVAIECSDTDPFYALIATPLAVHYDSEGEQEIIPLYMKNLEYLYH